jgi:hypothetical protein
MIPPTRRRFIQQAAGSLTALCVYPFAAGSDDSNTPAAADGSIPSLDPAAVRSFAGQIDGHLVLLAVAKNSLLADALIKALEEESSEARLESLVRLNARVANKTTLKEYLILQTALAQPVTDYDLIVRSSQDLWLPDYAAYRKTLDFKKLLTALGLPAYWRKHGWGDFCKPLGPSDFECR